MPNVVQRVDFLAIVDEVILRDGEYSNIPVHEVHLHSTINEDDDEGGCISTLVCMN